MSTSAAAPLLADSRAHDLLQQLVTDSESRFVVHSEDGEHSENSEQLRGVKICQKDDVLTKNIHGKCASKRIRPTQIHSVPYMCLGLVACPFAKLWASFKAMLSMTDFPTMRCS